MARSKKIPTSPRRPPLQDRSEKMVKAILEASKKLLLQQGYQGFNTNKIAELAGISIGSLYQYFPNKQSIASKLIEEFFQRLLTRNLARTGEFLALPPQDALKLAIEQILQSKDEIKLYRILVEESFDCIDKQIVKKFHGAFINLLQRRFAMRGDEIKVKDTHLAAFVVFQLLEGTLRSLARFETEIEPQKVLAEVSHMIGNYLTNGSATT